MPREIPIVLLCYVDGNWLTFLSVSNCTIWRCSRLCTCRCLQIMYEATLYAVEAVNMMTV
jgi:hypothetical protein